MTEYKKTVVDYKGYPICHRCHKRLSLEEDDYCSPCDEIVKKEVGGKIKWSSI